MNRIVELARLNLLAFKVPIRKSKNKVNSELSIADHALLLADATECVALAYTDGSASPNPGPSGGGVSIFVQNPDVVVDCGATLGMGTNNSAELFALGSCLTELRKLTRTHPHVTGVLIFSDSKLAINAATGSRRPLTNIPIVLALRKAFSALLSAKLTVAFHWVPGHAGIGGNDRVDKIAKTFATSRVAFDLSSLAGFSSCVSRNPWPFFPLRTAPAHVFALNLPVPVSFSRPTTAGSPRVSFVDTGDSDSDHLDHKHDV